MESLQHTIETTLYRHKLPGLSSINRDDSFITPYYDGLCLSNVAPTVAAMLGAKRDEWRPLDGRLWEDLSTGIRRVVLLVLDAVGYLQLQRWMKEEPDTLFARLGRNHRLVPITSVFPSTTTAALSSLWTGQPPVRHGLMGYQLFLRPWDVVANMISLSPVQSKQRAVLTGWGLEPETFLAVPSVGQVLAPHGITNRTLLRQSILESGLSKMHFRGIDDLTGHVLSSDLWVNLREQLQRHRNERLFLAAYWGGVDTVLHIYGPESEQWAAEMRSLAYSIEREFLAPLSAADREGTLLLITADHGQVRVPPQQAINLHDHPKLAQNLTMRPCGDPRAAYLYVRANHLRDVRAYIEEELGHAFVVLSAEEALEGGLFGDGPPAPQAAARIGDLVLLARERYMLYNRDNEPKLAGRHGGLHPEEMLVPLFAARLDDFRHES
ncbi:MAG: alkaline phosphatase family protein [Chloroflexi bacterium]|nr:alkaline phosphatase family protein [Chloroflexota bacterium]